MGVSLRQSPATSHRPQATGSGILLFSLLVTIAACLQAAAEAEDTPKAFVRQSKWDFGYLPQKSEVTHLFYLHNFGAAPLSVEKIKSGCACTSVSDIKDDIPPGDSIAIAVTFKSGRYHHGVRKVTEVYTNDPETSVQKLEIAADVVKDDDRTGSVSIEPRRIEVPAPGRSETDSADTVVISNIGQDPLDVTITHFPDKIFELMEFPESISPGESTLLLVCASENSVIVGDAAPSVTFAFVGSDTTIVTIPIEIAD